MSFFFKAIENTTLNTALILSINIVEILLLTYFISPVYFGHFGEIILIVSFVGLLGSGTAYQVILKTKKTHEFISLGLFLAIIQWLLFSLIYVNIESNSLININYVLALVSLIILVRIFNQFREAELIKDGLIIKINQSQLISSLLSLSLYIILVFIPSINKLFILLFGILIKDTILLISYKLNIKKIHPKNIYFYLSEMKHLRGYFYASLNGYIIGSIDKWFVIAFLGSHTLGLYAKARQIINIPIAICSRSITKDLQSGYLKNVGYQKNKKIIITSIITAISFSFIIYIFQAYFISYFFYNEWSGLNNYIFLLIPLVLTKTVMKIIDVNIRSFGTHKSYLFFYVIQTINIIVLLVVFIPQTGEDMALIMSGSSVISVLIGYKFIKKRRTDET